MKRVLITGVTNQDGAFLAEFLLDNGHEVHGIKRRASSFNIRRINHIYQDSHESHGCRGPEDRPAPCATERTRVRIADVVGKQLRKGFRADYPHNRA